MATRGSSLVRTAALASPLRSAFAFARRLARALPLGLLLLVGSILFAPSVGAEEDAASALPAPPLTLAVTPGSGGGPWKLHIENTGDVPVRIAADPRLLVLDVTPPAGAGPLHVAGKKPAEPATVRCILPDDARPATDEGRDLVVPSKRSWSVLVDPFFYCFAARERAALAPGASVKAHFGWPAPLARSGVPAAAPRGHAKTAAPSPPFAAAPVGAAIGKLSAAKELEGAAFTLGDGTLAAPGSTAATAASSGALTVSIEDAVDVARGAEITANVTVTNEGDKPATLLFRGETLRFAVSGPAGSVACGSTRNVESPIRELYATIGPKARASASVLLTAKCSFDTFDEPGVYRVTAILDTTGASARSIGLRTWDGEATSKSAMLLRVRSPRRPRTPATRPSLD